MEKKHLPIELEQKFQYDQCEYTWYGSRNLTRQKCKAHSKWTTKNFNYTSIRKRCIKIHQMWKHISCEKQQEI